MAKSTLDKKLILAQDAQRVSEERAIELQREVDRLESDRRFLAEREKEEREEKEAERVLFDEERVGVISLSRIPFVSSVYFIYLTRLTAIPRPNQIHSSESSVLNFSLSKDRMMT
jgi:hypothetical protein